MKKPLVKLLTSVAVCAIATGWTLSAAWAQQMVLADPLVLMLVKKGAITATEANSLGKGPATEQRRRLVGLLVKKGIITPQEAKLDTVDAPATEAPSKAAVSGEHFKAAVPVVPPRPVYASLGLTPIAPEPITTVPAVVPQRVLPVGLPAFNTLTNGINLGGGMAFQPYGSIIATYSHDSSSPYGNSFPLPGFIGDVNGPSQFPETHVNARNSILGANFQWTNPLSAVSVFGVTEMDFNGGSSVNNNIQASAISSATPRLRLAYGRVDFCADHCASPAATDFFVLAGQDWTPFASSTQPTLLERTLDGVGFGNIAARLPQVRIGVDQKLGTSRDLHIGAEFAVVQPASGDIGGPASAVTLQNELSQGERAGSDSDRPELQARLVTQFQLDQAEGVAPAQFILSGVLGQRNAVVNDAGVPAAFKAAFPNGGSVTTNREAFTVEAQLPTRWVTVSGKYYNGTDLRFYGGGQLLAPFNVTAGLNGIATATSLNGGSTVAFGLRNGAPVIAPQESPRAQGGFVELGLPISRWFNADAHGWNAGWSGHLTYGVDQVPESTVALFGGGRQKSEHYSAGLQYQLNRYVTFAFEEAAYHTRADPLIVTGTFPLFNGAPTADWWDMRTEFGVIVNF